MFSALVPLILAASTSYSPSVTQELTAPTGQLTFRTGVLSAPLEGEPRDAVRRFLASSQLELGLPPSSLLGPVQAIGTRLGASFHLPQLVDGVEVYQARVTVTVDSARRVVQVSSSLRPYRQAVVSWALDAAGALQLALKVIPGALLDPSGKPYGGTKRQVFVVGDEAHSGYLVHVPTLDLRENWFVGVDAVTRQVLFQENRVYNANRDAHVYVSSQGPLDAGIGLVPTVPVLIEHLAADNDGGFLNGDQLTAYNCCPNRDCMADGGAARSDGGLSFNGQTIPYDIVICQRTQRATNDPALHPEGNYIYPPQDPPVPATSPGGLIRKNDPADSDPFAEVHAFHHVNRFYDFVRGLSGTHPALFPDAGIPPFRMRDEIAGKKPAVWTNVILPDIQEAYLNAFLGGGVARTERLVHTDNAAFMPKENFEQLGLPPYSLDVDALLIFQGDAVDFAYDAPVLWHEFTHGVIYSTANFSLQGYALDSRSGNNEGGAMHEGLSDYFAGAFGQQPEIGQYVGPRLAAANAGLGLPPDIALRNMNNAYKCPEVLWGEVHQDGQHLSAALWQARQQIFQGTDEGHTFDAAVFAALVSLTPTSDFAQFAAAASSRVGQAFPGITDAGQKLSQVFAARGVTDCSKVMDITSVAKPQKPMFVVGTASGALLAPGAAVPGPHQFLFKVPGGAKSVTLTYPSSGGGLFGGGGTPTVRLLAKSGSPVTFTRAGAALTHDADVSVAVGTAGGNVTATANLAVPCGGELYVALANTGSSAQQIQNLGLTFAPAASCPEAPDAGSTITLPAIPDEGGGAGGEAAPTGCGCGVAGPEVFGAALLGLLGLVRRRARR